MMAWGPRAMALCNTRIARPQSIGESVSCRHESLAQPHMAQWMLACSPARGRDSFRPAASAQMLGAVACSPESVTCSQWCALTWLDLLPFVNQPPPDLSPPSPSALLRCTNAGTRSAHCPSDTRPSLSDPSVHRLLSTACMQIRACFSPSRLQRCATPHVSAVRESSRKRSKPSVGPQWLSRISICWEALAISWLAALTHV